MMLPKYLIDMLKILTPLRKELFSTISPPVYSTKLTTASGAFAKMTFKHFHISRK